MPVEIIWSTEMSFGVLSVDLFCDINKHTNKQIHLNIYLHQNMYFKKTNDNILKSMRFLIKSGFPVSLARLEDRADPGPHT